jgi:hypothetical protein
VKERGHQDFHVVHAADGGDGGRDVDRVVDVRALVGALAALVAVLVRGEARGVEEPRQIGLGCGGGDDVGLRVRRVAVEVRPADP